MRGNLKNIVWTILFLFLITSTALLTYLHFFAAGDKDLSGNWITKPDMTKQAAVTALSWLQDIDAVSVSLEDMEAYMQGLTIEVNLTLDQTADSEGTFHCNVLPESYDACNQAAYEAFAAAFRDLLLERLRMAGYTGGTDDETIEMLVTETFGMPTVSYLMSCAPELLPPLEDLQAQYDGSGAYITSEGMLIRQYDAEGQAVTKTESYIRKDSKLVLTEETDSGYLPTIYILQQSQNQ
ncbi:MAG: hypothetical protein K2P35_04170 [Lachnospiraceae bacterium]|jgi:hypothetical protein|nr:hypothetical protein [Lachnospiraceae bacterium]